MTTRPLRLILPLLALAATCCAQSRAAPSAPYPDGHRSRINGHVVLHLAGAPEDLGAQHARLVGRLVRETVNDVIVEGEGAGTQRESLIRGAMVMEKYLPPDIRAELKALADGARVEYEDLVALQLFGDVKRGQYCTSFAVFGPATSTGECIIGRNMDYWDHGATENAGCIIHYTPRDGIPFMTVSWCGVINGWTAMNARGIVCANNSAYGGEDSLEGLSTCFMVRKVAQFAATVEEGVEIVQSTPRACGTNLIIAGGNPPNAAIVEYDHDQVVVRWAKNGWVCAANSFRVLGRTTPLPDEPEEEDSTPPYGGYYYLSRDDLLAKLIREHHGRIDDTMNFAAAEGVPIRSINLHSSLLFPQRLAFRVSMGEVPAADQPYRRYRMTEQGIVSDE